MFRSSDRRGADRPEIPLEQLPGRVHLLAERIDTLAQTVAATAAGMAKKDGEIAVLRRELEAGLAHLGSAQTRAAPAADADELRRLRERIEALAAERARTAEDKQVAALAAKVAHLAERVDTLATTVATTAAGLAGREGEIAALRRRLDERLVQQDANATGESTRKRIDDLGAATASASMRLESHSTQIASLRDALDARQEALESALALLAERVQRSEQDRAALATSVAEAAATRWRELERTLVSLGERLDALERDRADATAELARATSLWPAALRSLEARIAELTGPRDEQRQGAREGTSPAEPASPAPPALPASPAAAPRSAPAPSSPLDLERFLAEIRSLERRLEESDLAARRAREELGTRVERLESARTGATDDERLPVGADVLPFRSLET